MTTVARDSTNHRSGRSRRPDHCRLHPRFATIGDTRCPTQSSSAGTSAPTKTKTLTPSNLYCPTTSYLPVHTTIALTVKPISNGAGPISEKSPTYGIEKLFETGNEGLHPLRLQNQEWRQFPEYGVLHHRRSKIKEIEVYLRFCPKETSVTTITEISAEANAASFRHFR